MAIPKKVAQVLKGVKALNDTERDEFVRRVNELLSDDATKKRILNEDLFKSLSITFGPLPASCPCCGR